MTDTPFSQSSRSLSLTHHYHHPLYNSDPRYLNALLAETKWADHVKGLDPDELRSLVRLPGADEFHLLKETVEWIIEVAMICIEETPEIILQLLEY